MSNKEPVEKFYTFAESLGSGTFSTVKKGINKKSGEIVAIKIIDKKSVGDKTEMIQTEIDILRRVRHPYIIGMKEMFETPTTIYLIMELVTGGELFDKIVERGAYSEKDASKLVKEILDALSYLHKNGVVHRDLKPENLLYASDDVNADIKIADFGLSKILGSEILLKTACGTPGYVAPEVLKCEGYDQRVDLWSVGVIMYILLCGFPPFYDENTAVLFEQIMEGKFEFPSPYWDTVSESAKDLVSHLLDVSPTKRYTAEEAMKHPWISGNTATEEKMPGVLEKMKEFNAKRKLKSGMLGVLAAQKLFRIK